MWLTSPHLPRLGVVTTLFNAKKHKQLHNDLLEERATVSRLVVGFDTFGFVLWLSFHSALYFGNRLASFSLRASLAVLQTASLSASLSLSYRDDREHFD